MTNSYIDSDGSEYIFSMNFYKREKDSNIVKPCYISDIPCKLRRDIIEVYKFRIKFYGEKPTIYQKIKNFLGI